jgi:hypothetical protein
MKKYAAAQLMYTDDLRFIHQLSPADSRKTSEISEILEISEVSEKSLQLIQIIPQELSGILDALHGELVFLDQILGYLALEGEDIA